jgi:hypothetical protein
MRAIGIPFHNDDFAGSWTNPRAGVVALPQERYRLLSWNLDETFGGCVLIGKPTQNVPVATVGFRYDNANRHHLPGIWHTASRCQTSTATAFVKKESKAGRLETEERCLGRAPNDQLM